VKLSSGTVRQSAVARLANLPNSEVVITLEIRHEWFLRRLSAPFRELPDIEVHESGFEEKYDWEIAAREHSLK
jgi:hypothetical protein